MCCSCVCWAVGVPKEPLLELGQDLTIDRVAVSTSDPIDCQIVSSRQQWLFADTNSLVGAAAAHDSTKA